MAAIYMWFENEEMILTTTLYPVELIDSLSLSCRLTYGELKPIPVETYEMSGTLLSITLPQILFSYGPDDEQYQMSGTLLGITLPVILIIHPEDEEEYTMSGTLMSITLPLKLVTVYAPVEKLQLNCDINPAYCSMTGV